MESAHKGKRVDHILEGFVDKKSQLIFLFITMVESGNVPIISIKDKYQGPVVQSIVSLTTSLRGQLVKCFTTL